MSDRPPAQRFPYIAIDQTLSQASLLPYLPLKLIYGEQSLAVQGMLDTGATVNVLPYDVGLQLGAIWDNQTVPVKLTGNLANLEAKALVVTVSVASFAPVRLAFAWTQANQVPIILGQINFFLEFEVCFYRAQAAFEVRPKT